MLFYTTGFFTLAKDKNEFINYTLRDFLFIIIITNLHCVQNEIPHIPLDPFHQPGNNPY